MSAYRTGWIPTPAGRPRVRFTAALREGTAPASCDYSHLPQIGMHLNDTWGCCVLAADASVVEVMTYYGQGSEVVVPDEAVLQAYEAVGHFDPNAGSPGSNPTDNGAQVPDGLKYLQQHGMAGSTIAGYGDVDPAAVERIKTAIYEFGAVDFGVNLPASAQAQFQAGLDAGRTPVWDYDPAADNSIEGGHCILAVGYNTSGFLIFTWNAVVLVTWAWWARFGSEAWAVVSHDWVSATSGKDPDGVDLEVLGQEYAAVTGQNPFPPPLPPAPEPPPAPPKPKPHKCGAFGRALRWFES